jgi:hypothetical protein
MARNGLRGVGLVDIFTVIRVCGVGVIMRININLSDFFPERVKEAPLNPNIKSNPPKGFVDNLFAYVRGYKAGRRDPKTYWYDPDLTS